MYISKIFGEKYIKFYKNILDKKEIFSHYFSMCEMVTFCDKIIFYVLLE